MNLDSLRSAAVLPSTTPRHPPEVHGRLQVHALSRANSRYETERAVARKNGDWNGIVDARAARRHISKLSKAGIGYNRSQMRPAWPYRSRGDTRR